ncbi:hypothetical protein BU24DRAFT_438352 [Aaosphaeria arxii CBS 175.79]|uniref:ATP-dependent DNA ligase family profile domain-containing protein n=1 Tax=Aaosphaeria arxii CBS 175.79 TaxID=1450172 RepID=A0A6A5Y6D8_9PLEO|nr:uncharacterized protein BU24DRAFT_438352 [Aaosphaeria arxii CBS 175.79]KAF2021088.1 hypothetical protein BU24DRAFT_438352 [Aaosphaeria arxii CBS 175.79]
MRKNSEQVTATSVSTAEELSFNHVCQLLQGVENIVKTKTITSGTPNDKEEKKVRNFIAGWFAEHRKAIDHPSTDGGAFLSIVFPHHRKDRVHGFKTPSLARKIANLLQFNNAQRLVYDRWEQSKDGDLGVYVERAMRPWDNTWKNKKPISISRVDRLLVQLAAKCRFSDIATRRKKQKEFSTDTELKNIFIQLESWEAKWFVRLILRDHCTLNLNETFVFGRYHFLLPLLLKFQNDFGAAFSLLRSELKEYPPVPPSNDEQRMRLEAAWKLRPVVGVKIGRPPFYKAWSFKHCFDMLNQQAWAAEIKYDGEYCEIHVNLDDEKTPIQIFSKNGKDATNDRKALCRVIRSALRLGQTTCRIRRNCVILGEMVLYSDKERKILPFSKIRKHISRSGMTFGAKQDSLPHEWEHLMIVFFDVLVLDDDPVLRKTLQDRRNVLRDLVDTIPGRSMRSQWTLLDFKKSSDGMTDLKQAFALALAQRQEGLVLKPLHSPYFPMHTGIQDRRPGFFIKMKKDYLADMGGSRDLGDFAIVGASYNPQIAAKSHVRPLHWTHFHLGCLKNKASLHHTGVKPLFKIVGVLSLEHCIPKHDLRYLNIHGRLRERQLDDEGCTEEFDFEESNGFDAQMSVAFKQPFVAEILGGGYETVQNETFEMLRHPRLKKIHSDRTWEDAVTMEDLEALASEKWCVPDHTELSGHARDVALLMRRYVGRQDSTTTAATLTSSAMKSGGPPNYQTTPSISETDPSLPSQSNTTSSTSNATQCTSSTREEAGRLDYYAPAFAEEEGEGAVGGYGFE